MFDEIREWNRENINGYIEVFLNPSEAVLKSRDKKGIFKAEYFKMELPKSPDIIISDDGNVSIRDAVKKIEEIVPAKEDDYDRDREYWNKYYEGLAGEVTKPSDFCVEIEKKLNPSSHIMELGCGNGRDSMYFLAKGHRLTAIDGSDEAIDMLVKKIGSNEKALFVCDDFVKCHALYQMQYDCVYSRFTLHAITDDQEDELLTNVKEALSSGGILCIEARTIHDELFGRGTKVGHNAYEYNDHFRRFIDVDEFRDKLKDMGFDVEYIEEAQGFSKTADSDPVLMRVIARISR